MGKKVTAIPATLNRFTSAPAYSAAKKRVAGYARVSTDLEKQQSSYEAQMDYYKTYISSRNDWEFVGMYSDEGITATNTKHREGFKRMVADALDGKIDLIITKSISRFARNTVDSLTTVRKLKDKGVEVYFEKENIWTLDSKGELLITIMSSLAQEESRSISENTTWGKRKAFADGKATVTFSRFLGYDKGFVINEEQAKTVRLIFKLYLSGYSMSAICKELRARGIKTVTGKDAWFVSTVESVLRNEKYKGDALLQKGYTVDFLEKKLKKNTGEVPQYYVEGHHKPIIEPAVFDLVQAEMRRKDQATRFCKGGTVYTSKILCGDCGNRFTPVIWHSNDKYRRQVYRCIRKYEGECICGTPAHSMDEIRKAFVTAVNRLLDAKEETLANLEKLRDMADDTAPLEEEKERLKAEIPEAEKSLRALIDESTRVAMSQEEYDRRYTELYGQYEQKRTRRTEIEDELLMKRAMNYRIKIFIERLIGLEGEQTTFDENLWAGILDHMTVYRRMKFVFTFVGGLEVTIE